MAAVGGLQGGDNGPELLFLFGGVHKQRTYGLSNNPIGEFYQTLLHLNPLRNGANVEED